MSAKAPYNFVPLPDRILSGRNGNKPLPDFSTYTSEGYPHTGWLDVTYRTLTPTFTRAAKPVPDRGYPESLCPDDKGQPADFFHHGDIQRTPVLPGSSLRGMIRAAFEILTYSKMGKEFFNNQPLSLRFFASPNTSLRDQYNSQYQPDKLVAGILCKVGDRWELHVSNDASKGFVAVSSMDTNLPLDTHYKGLKNLGRPIHQKRQIVVSPSGAPPVDLLRNAQKFSLPLYHVLPAGATGPSAFLIVPGADIGHRHYYQAVLDSSTSASGFRNYAVPASSLDAYDHWRERSPAGARPRCLRDGEPAFAMLNAAGTEAEVIFAGLMMAFRYVNSIHSVANRIYPPIDQIPQTDMTQAVFGRVDDEPTLTRKSRVFFEDATTTHSTPWLSTSVADSIRIPDILSSPEPTAVQMYLEQGAGGALDHWDTPEARIRGYKRYWHRPLEAVRNTLHPNTDDLGTQKTRIRPVKEGIRFAGRVRFENLSDRELGALLASVQLPGGLAHRFGMGKNLGLGSLEVVSVRATLIDCKVRYASLVPNAGHQPELIAVQTLKSCYQTFVDCVRRHEQRGVRGEPANNPVDLNNLWVSPRLKAFGFLLRHNPALNAEQTRQVSVGDDAAAGQWTQRVRLARPIDLAGGQFPTIQDIYS